MRIAFFVSAFPLLSETFILNQITGLIDRGHHVDIYAKNPGEMDKVHEDVRRYGLLESTFFAGDMPQNPLLRCLKAIALTAGNLNLSRLKILGQSLNFHKFGRAASSLRLFYETLPLLNGSDYDVLHCQFGTIGPNVSRLRQIGAVRGSLIVSFRGSDATRYMKNRPGVYDALFREADLIMTVSRSLKKILVGAGCNERKIVVHHSGIDCSRLEFSGRTRAANAPAKILSVARLVEKKGIGVALDAIALLIAGGRQVKYTVIGDGPLRGDLESTIKKAGIERNVELAGWKTHDEVIAAMKEYDILIAPSITADSGDQEGIPNAVKEAMALGLPVVGTDHGGIPELIINNTTGYLVPEKSSDVLAERIGYIMDNPETALVMSRSARLYVQKYFDINTLNNHLVETYAQAGEQIYEPTRAHIVI